MPSGEIETLKLLDHDVWVMKKRWDREKKGKSKRVQEPPPVMGLVAVLLTKPIRSPKSPIQKSNPTDTLAITQLSIQKKKEAIIQLSLNIVTIFVLVCTKIYVYFIIKTYFFYFTCLIFKTLHIRLFILHYISIKYQFSLFTFFFNTQQPLTFFIHTQNT